MTDRAFKPGDRVVVIDGPRKGYVTTVTGELIVTWGDFRASPSFRAHGLNPGTVVYDLDIQPAPNFYAVCAPPAWLRHYDDSRDKAADVPEWIADLVKRKEPVNG